MTPHGDEPDDAHTPLDEDESDGLIPTHLATRGELNQWEGLNVTRAYEWISRRRPPDLLDVAFLRELHRRMFGETWAWAGTFRRSDKNLSPFTWHEVPVLMANLMENTRARHAAGDASPVALDDLAARFHHELVRIHPWPNGNGRHARLATDLLLDQWGRPHFSWGEGADLEAPGKARMTYVAALRSADAGDLSELRRFCRT